MIADTCETKGSRPAADAGEKMALVVSCKFSRLDIPYIPVVDIPLRDVARGDQVAEPLHAEGVILVVVCGQRFNSTTFPT